MDYGYFISCLEISAKKIEILLDGVSIQQAKWEQIYHHPLIGEISAADLLAAWAAHDYLHLRQLSDLQARYLNVLASPHSTKYASP